MTYCLAVLISGCGSLLSGGESKSSARLVTLSELEEATKHQDRIAYLGKEEKFTYFYVEGQGFFRIEPGWTSLPPLSQKGSEPICYVRIKDGKFVLVQDE